MTPRSVNLLYFSPTGNCRKVAQAIGRGIGVTPCQELDRTTPAGRMVPQHFLGRDLTVIVLPVYGGRLPRIIEGIFSGITANKAPAAFVVVYGNRGYDDALLELKNVATRKGFIGIAAAAFSSEHALSSKVGTGRPDAADIAIMERFGKNLGKKMDAMFLPETRAIATIPGSFPYEREAMQLQVSPVTVSAACHQCHTCINICPMGAISTNNPGMVDRTKCISCCHCIRSCPHAARSMCDPGFLEGVRTMENANLPRMEAEIFI